MKVVLKQGDSLRFLSLLLWYNGERDKALSLARQAIEILETGFPTRELALAYSNLSSLYLSINDKDQSIEWGKKAEYLADRLEDDD
jgi:tetratricopeptide (TPR) repeat protein